MRSGRADGQDGGVRVTLGVDTHADLHVGVALDQFGRRLGTRSIATSTAGFAELLAWASAFGVIEQIGIEGTGSYGAGASRGQRRRPRHRRCAARGGRRQSRPAAQRGRLCQPLWGRAHPGVLGKDQPAPPQPRWRS